MKAALRLRFWVETFMAAASLVFAVLTVVWRDWIEIVFRVDPDHHSGSLEVGVVVFCVAATVAWGALAGRQWRRLRPATEAA